MYYIYIYSLENEAWSGKIIFHVFHLSLHVEQPSVDHLVLSSPELTTFEYEPVNFQTAFPVHVIQPRSVRTR